MPTTTVMKRGDTAPTLTITCYDDVGASPVDLTPATGIRLIAYRGVTEVIDTAVTGNASGVIVYAWQTADTATTGTLQLEVEVTWPDTTIQTFPANGFLTVTVVPDLD